MWNQKIRQIGFDNSSYEFEEIEFCKKIRPIHSSFWADRDYIIETDTSEGIKIRLRNYNLVYTQNKVENEFLFFSGLYYDKVYFVSHTLKKNFRKNISTGTFEEIPYKSILPGIPINNLQFCAFRNEIWLYDFENDTIKWKHTILPMPKWKEWYSKNLYWKDEIVITNMSYEYLKFINLKTGKESNRINASDFENIKHNKSIGPHYIVDDLLICLGDIQRDKTESLTYKNAGSRDLIAFDLKSKQLEYRITIQQWLNKLVSSKKCIHSIYYNGIKEEIYYCEIDLTKGETIFDFSIHKQIKKIYDNEKHNEIREMLNFEPRIDGMFYANNCLYFGYGSHYLRLNPITKEITTVIKRNDLISHSTPIVLDDKMIITDTIYKMK